MALPVGVGLPVMMHVRMTAESRVAVVSSRGFSKAGASAGPSSADKYESSDEPSGKEEVD